METSGRSVGVLGWRGVVGLSLAAVALMIAVSAGTGWATNMWLIAESRRKLASWHAKDALRIEKIVGEIDSGSRPNLDNPRSREAFEQSIRHHRQMEEKYLAIARQPWAPFPKDFFK